MTWPRFRARAERLTCGRRDAERWQADKATALSAVQMYEFHSTQQGTMIWPGQTCNLDYSLTQSFSLQGNVRLQLGLVGYGPWQTTDKRGPIITPQQGAAHYRVNALGFAANLTLPDRKAAIGAKYFREFQCRSTFQDTHCRFPARLTSDRLTRGCCGI
jgi:hypothetical protein